MEGGCLRCENPNVEWHHVYPSDRRPRSTEEGCLAPLCRYHHQGKGGVHQLRRFDFWLKADCQRRWEEREMREFGVDQDEARRRFMVLFFENYIY
jgi:hypothetical protein